MKRGVTLIELMVVIVILGIVFTIAIVNYRNNQKDINLKLTAQELQSALNEAYSLSLSANADNITGYGVRMENTEYFVFADTNGNKTYDSGDTKNTSLSYRRFIEVDKPTGTWLEIYFRSPFDEDEEPGVTPDPYNPALPYKTEVKFTPPAIEDTSTGIATIGFKVDDTPSPKYKIKINKYVNTIVVE